MCHATSNSHTANHTVVQLFIWPVTVSVIKPCTHTYYQLNGHVTTYLFMYSYLLPHVVIYLPIISHKIM